MNKNIAKILVFLKAIVRKGSFFRSDFWQLNVGVLGILYYRNTKQLYFLCRVLKPFQLSELLQNNRLFVLFHSNISIVSFTKYSLKKGSFTQNNLY